MKFRFGGFKKKKVLFAFMCAFLLGTTGCGEVVIVNNTETEGEAGKTGTGNMQDGEKVGDAVPRPQDDYYGFINKEALHALEVNYKSMGGGYAFEMQNAVDAEIYEMLHKIAKSEEAYEPGSNEQLVRDFYGQILAFLQGEKTEAVKVFLEESQEIRQITNLDQCRQMMMRLHEKGIPFLFDGRVSIDYFEGSRYVFYLMQADQIVDVKLKDIYEDDQARKMVSAYAGNVLISCGEERKAAEKKAEDFVYALIDIACNTDFSVEELSNPFIAFERKTGGELNGMLQNFTLQEIEQIYGVDNPYDCVMLEDVEQVILMDSLFTEENVEVLKTWMLCSLMKEYQDFLAPEYPFLEGNGNVSEERAEKMACAAVASIMDDEISELYAKYYYTEEMDAQLQKMYQDIQKGYETLITGADWLSEGTRQSLLRKLQSMKFVYGGGTPHVVQKEDADMIGKDAFWTMRNLKAKAVADEAKRLGQKPDPTRSIMSSHVINAAYNPTNTFTITVAIMHAPYFDVKADYAENMGGLGMVMAHEIGHAFDSNCIDFDENGAYRPERIPKEDREKLNESLKQMEEYYSAFRIMQIYHVDGQKTSGENYADKGAMECLMTIIKEPEKQKLLFENYARIWMQMMEDKSVLEQIWEDEHSPNVVRVNAVLSSTEEFYQIYQVKEGDGMYVSPEKRVRRW